MHRVDLELKICILISICLIPLVHLTGCASINMHVLNSKEKVADEDFRKQDYAVAAAEYDYLYRIHPDSAKKEYFLIQKGRSLYQMKDYVDAQRVFKEYNERYPEGHFADEIRVLIGKIAVTLSASRIDTCELDEEIRGDLQRIEDMLTSQPYNANLHYELANTYWSLREYKKAAKEYLVATEIDAALKENELIKRRLMVNESGEIVPVTPDLQAAMERERNPLVFFDINDYTMRSTEDFYSARQTYVTVAGKVRNQSNRLLRQVVVEVSFYNVHRELLDVRTYRLGTMGPGEVRGFVVQSNFHDDIGNVYSFETQAYYE